MLSLLSVQTISLGQIYHSDQTIETEIAMANVSRQEEQSDTNWMQTVIAAVQCTICI